MSKVGFIGIGNPKKLTEYLDSMNISGTDKKLLQVLDSDTKKIMSPDFVLMKRDSVFSKTLPSDVSGAVTRYITQLDSEVKLRFLPNSQRVQELTRMGLLFAYKEQKISFRQYVEISQEISGLFKESIGRLMIISIRLENALRHMSVTIDEIADSYLKAIQDSYRKSFPSEVERYRRELQFFLDSISKSYNIQEEHMQVLDKIMHGESELISVDTQEASATVEEDVKDIEFSRVNVIIKGGGQMKSLLTTDIVLGVTKKVCMLSSKTKGEDEITVMFCNGKNTVKVISKNTLTSTLNSLKAPEVVPGSFYFTKCLEQLSKVVGDAEDTITVVLYDNIVDTGASAKWIEENKEFLESHEILFMKIAEFGQSLSEMLLRFNIDIRIKDVFAGNSEAKNLLESRE